MPQGIHNRLESLPWSQPNNVGFIVPERRAWTVLTRLYCWLYRAVEALLEREGAQGAFFLFVPVFVGAGAVTYFQLDFEPSWDRLLLLLILSIVMVRLLRPFRPLMLLCGLLVAALSGAVFAKIETARLNTRFIPWEITTEITARVMEWQAQAEGGYRLIVKIVATEADDTPLREEQKIRLSARSLPPGLEIGDGITGLVRLRPPSGPVRRGAYDFSFHAFYRGLSAQGFFMGTPQPATLPPPTGIFERLPLAIAALRNLISKRISTAIAGEAGAIASALITGERAGISNATNEALRLSGLAHILAISGLHMAMVTGMVLLLCRSILGLFPNFSSRHSQKKIASLIALVVAGFYLVLSGSDVAAQRSFIMVAVMLLAVLCDRSAITMRNLSLAALITLIVVPHEIMGPSFQMSFSATAALIAAYGWWSERRRARQGWGQNTGKGSMLYHYMVLPLCSTAIASLVAGLSSGIFAAYHFANTAPLGIVSNAAAVPVMSFAVMPFALLGAMCMPLGLEWLPLHIMGFGVELVKRIAFFVADISPNVNPGFVPPEALMFFTLGLVLLLFLRTILRFLAVLPFLIGIALYIATPTPLALISEDGRLVAVRTATGKLALSNSRPPSFILSNWLPIFNIGSEAVLLPQQENGFDCDALMCRLPLASPQEKMAIALGPSLREQACREGKIVVLNYSSPIDKDCDGDRLVIALSQLALYGTAALYEAGSGYRVEWVVGETVRPWHRHRRFSKTALGMP